MVEWKRGRRAGFLLVFVALGSCAHDARQPEAPPRVALQDGPAAPPPPPVVDAAPRKLHRKDVLSAIRAGLGAFLGHVETTAVVKGGEFAGFKVLALRPAEQWQGIDVHVGDVVVTINGGAIGRPEQSFQVFQGLATANEIRLAIVRDGKPLETVIPIIE